MSQVLYRKYRSHNLDQIIGQDHVTSVLKKAISQNKLAHAYLLTGPRGVGKTSIARILAYEVNKVEYSDGANYIDIIEIDAASNRRIDEIRELRDKINIMPTQLDYKVYVIDEVHMLTREAFNALLKTLEEPPAHAIFVLATTELHKVPETIVSRCQRFSFKRISKDTAKKELANICKKEDIDADDDALELIAKASGGSFRDALSILDQLSSLSSKITAKEVESVLGIASSKTVEQIARAYRSGQIVDISSSFRSAVLDGNDPVVLAQQIAEYVRSKLNSSTTAKNDLQLLDKLLQIPQATNPELSLEIALLQAPGQVNAAAPPAVPELAATNLPKASVEPKPKPATPKPTANKAKAIKPKPTAEAKPAKKELSPADNSAGSNVITLEDWPSVLSEVKQAKNTLYSVLRMAKVSIQDGDIHLRFGFVFHVNRAKDGGNKTTLEQAIRKLDLTFSSIEIVQDADAKPDPADAAEPTQPTPEPAPTKEPIPEEISNIFGGGEVLES